MKKLRQIILNLQMNGEGILKIGKEGGRGVGWGGGGTSQSLPIIEEFGAKTA